MNFVFFGADDEVNDPIDAAYRAKYRRYPPSIVNSVLIPGTRSATIELVSLSI